MTRTKHIKHSATCSDRHKLKIKRHLMYAHLIHGFWGLLRMFL